MDWIKPLIPASLRAELRRGANRLIDFGENQIIAGLYNPRTIQTADGLYSMSSESYHTTTTAATVALPPDDLRMEYYMGADEAYLASGKETAAMVRAVCQDYGVAFGKDDTILEFGCASGRVLRHFTAEAHTCEYWGVDVDEASIIWNKVNLGNHFNFVTTTAYPHLPFADEKFSFIYGISVFTHMRHLTDTWLLELNRVLKPDGIALFTIMDEHSVQEFQKHGKHNWMPTGMDLAAVLQQDFTVLRGNQWNYTFSIYSTNWIRQEWGRYFQVLEIRPRAEDNYQSAVILKKK